MNLDGHQVNTVYLGMPIPRTILADDPLADLDLELVAGRWPADLDGEIFISTSEQATAPFHAFFGDGAMIRLSLAPGSFGAAPDRWAWRAATLRTPSRRLRERCPDQFTASALGTMSPFGHVNAANTAPLPWGDRLFATWDAGRPVEIDPVTFAFLGEVGHRDDWAPVFDHPVLPLIPSTAHPLIDPDRDCLWTVALDPMGQQVQIVRYDGHGTHVRRWPVTGAPVPQSMHTIAQTRNWLILVDTNFRADPVEIFGGERTVTTLPDEPVYLIRKDVLEMTATGEAVTAAAFRIAPEVMHYYAVYDDSDGIRVIFEHTEGLDLGYWLRDDDVDAHGRPVDPRLRGFYNTGMAPAALSVLQFDPETGVVKEQARVHDRDRYWNAQLSALDWSTEGMSAPTVHTQVFSGFKPDGIARRVLDRYAADGRVDPATLPAQEIPARLATFERDGLVVRGEWVYGDHEWPSSPTFVPRRPGTGGSRYAPTRPGGDDGWIVLPVLNDDRFRVDVFDAAAVAAGPVASLAAPPGTTVPFLIHSAWMPRAVTAPAVERLRFADELDHRLSALPDDLQAAAHEVARNLDADQ